MLGFFTAITKISTADVMKKALPGLVPDRFLDLNIKAFDKGYEYGIQILDEEKQK
jgi:2-oxoglutarate ferredoxin oxidoreductase subunit gamma